MLNVKIMPIWQNAVHKTGGWVMSEGTCCDCVRQDMKSLGKSLSNIMAIFPGRPELASTRMSPFTGAKDKGSGGDNRSYRQTNTQLFTGRMHFLSPNQQCQSTEGNNVTFRGLAHPKLIWVLLTLSLTTNSSWLP